LDGVALVLNTECAEWLQTIIVDARDHYLEQAVSDLETSDDIHQVQLSVQKAGFCDQMLLKMTHQLYTCQ